MDGEFVCEDLFGTVKGVAGGNFLILARTQRHALAAAEAAMDAVRTVPGVLVLVFGALAIRSWRRGKRTAGGVLTVVPFLTTLPLLAMMMV